MNILDIIQIQDDHSKVNTICAILINICYHNFITSEQGMEYLIKDLRPKVETLVTQELSDEACEKLLDD